MPQLVRRITPLALLALGAGALSAAPIGAQSETKPTPTCAGVSIVDPEGDHSQGGDNSDVTAAFFVTKDGVTTLNIRVQNLTDEVPSGFTGVTWYGIWKNAAGANRFVSGDIDFEGAVTFAYGSYTNPGAGFQQEGDTTGKLHTGAAGVIEIVIPPAELGEEKLAAPYIDSRLSRSVPGVGGIVSQADRAPDADAGPDYVVRECGAGEPVPPEPKPQPKPSGGGGSGGGGSSGGGSSTNPAPAPAQSQPATLPVTLSTKSARASRSLRFRISAREKVTKLAARLLSGKRSVATGRLSKVGKRSTLRLRGKRKLKKGRYVLELTGLNARGQRGSIQFRVRLR